MKQRKSLINRLSFALALMFVLGGVAGVYGLYKFRIFSQQLETVNSQYVPALRVVSQIRSHLFLFESDFDRALGTKTIKRDSFHLQMISSKIGLLRRVYRKSQYENQHLAGVIDELSTNFERFQKLLLSADVNDAAASAQLLREKRNLRLLLQNTGSELDRRIRDSSLLLQKAIYNDFILVAAVLLCAFAFAVFAVYWFRKELRPLKHLTEVVRNITSSGILSSNTSVTIPSVKQENEVSVLAREFNTMAHSIRDQAMELERQKERVEAAYQELSEQNEKLKRTRSKLLHTEKLALVGRLTAQMAHEIRNPLNAMGLHIELIEQDMEGQHESIEALKRETERLSQVATDYLKVARKPNLQFERYSIRDVVEESLAVYAPELQSNNIQVQVYFEDDVTDLELDVGNVKQVVQNLIKNSAEAMRSNEGPSQLNISVCSNHQKKMVDLFFEDNGSGIADTDAVFAPFFTTKSDGTGLGLAHSRQIIEAHGGEISCHSGDTTVFKVSLPMEVQTDV